MEARGLWATLSAVAACLEYVAFLGGLAIDNIQWVSHSICRVNASYSISSSPECDDCRPHDDVEGSDCLRRYT